MQLLPAGGNWQLSDNIQLGILRRTLNDELERIWKEVGMA
jgi:hypothetical protein